MQLFMALLSGLLFGAGLIISGMTDPSKVIGFLDVAGRWNPSLAFVMGGAVLVGLVAFRLARRRSAVFGGPIQLPSMKHIDRRLVLGSVAFGLGWGLAGYCPGAALASLAAGGKPLIFSLSMLAGMLIFEIQERFFPLVPHSAGAR
jgi:uncharacterized membrane protein YedE/YeeE